MNKLLLTLFVIVSLLSVVWSGNLFVLSLELKGSETIVTWMFLHYLIGWYIICALSITTFIRAFKKEELK